MLFVISYHRIPWITISYTFCNKAKETLPIKSQTFKDYRGYVNKVLLKCQRKKYSTWRTQTVPAGSDPASKLQFCSTKGNDISPWPNQGSVRRGSPSPWPSHWRDPRPLRACVWAQSCPTLWVRGLWPSRVLRPWNFSGKNIGVGAISSSRRIFLTRVTNLRFLRLLHCRRILYQLNNLGSHGPWDLPPTAPGSWPPQRLLFLLSTQSGCPPIHCICWNPIQAFGAFISFKDMPLLSQQIGTLFLLKSHRSFPQLFYDIIFCLKPWLLVPYFSY